MDFTNVISMNTFDICIDTQKLLRTFLKTTTKDVTSSIFLSQTSQKKLSPIAAFCDAFPPSKLPTKIG